jgi:type II secretory pathway component GspD/PulD (secretin)
MRAIFTVLVLALLLSARASAQSVISIDARDTDLDDVIRLIALQSGLNIVADSSVKSRRVTFRLHDVNSAIALATLTQAYDLQIHRAGNIVLVGDAAAMNRRFGDETTNDTPHTEIFALSRAKPEDVSTALLATLPAGTVAVPDKRTSSVIITASLLTITRARRLVAALDGPPGNAVGVGVTSVGLHYAKPSDALKSLKATIPDAGLLADDRSNSVLITGRPEVLETARALLSRIDQPGRQVLFEVRVTDVKPIDDSSDVGLQFGGTGFGTGALAQFPYTLTTRSVVVNAQLDALVQTGSAQILATPRIATLNNREATLLVGETYPIVTVNQQTGYPSVTNVNVGVQLRVTPTIGDTGTITAELHPEYSAIIGFNNNFPIIANRKIDATLTVRDGETIVLGGLFEETSSETIAKLPFLGDIPVLGQFFKNKATSHQRDEVVFLITPHIIEEPPAAAAEAAPRSPAGAVPLP